MWHVTTAIGIKKIKQKIKKFAELKFLKLYRVYNYDYFYTNCYTWNSGYDKNGNKVELKTISEDGSDRSFKLELFVGREDLDYTKFAYNYIFI